MSPEEALHASGFPFPDQAVRANRSFAAEHTQAGQNDELLQSQYAWSNNVHADDEALQTRTSIDDSDPSHPLYPPKHSSIIDLSSPAGSANQSDSDFSFIEASPEDLPQADGLIKEAARARTAKSFPSSGTISGQSKKKPRKQSTGQRTNLDLPALPGASDMEAGSSNDYHSPDWEQAGHNATEQDLAGPGAHGKLQCVVSKPQKEGEGTQNAYISYLVTTDVGLEYDTYQV